MNSLNTAQGLLEFQKNPETVRHCKIVGTLGPSSSNEATLRRLIEAGLNIARLNFSHGDHATHQKNIEMIRRVSEETNRQVTILQDLQGPKIRCGKLLNDRIQLESGEIYKLIHGEIQTDPQVIPIDYKDLVRDVSVGDQVMMDDGLLILEVTAVEGASVTVTVIEGGPLKNRKGVNFPDTKLSLPAMTEKDSKDLLFGISQGVDVVALSFVQTPADILQCKKMISALGSDVPVIAKIEKISAVESIHEIAKVADGLMVARGDLGVEGKVEKVPVFQRKIVDAGANAAIPVIIATQMLESMINNPQASFAEVADVANGVLDGADCLMLSGEVAAGQYPVECVQKMDSIIREVESWHQRRPARYKTVEENPDTEWATHEAVARAACEAADEIKARAIVCLTLTGSIARSISKWRPYTPVIAISPRNDAIQRLGLAWGVYGLKNPLFYNTDGMLENLPKLLLQYGVVQKGDAIVITAGIPINQIRPTNMLKINVIQ